MADKRRPHRRQTQLPKPSALKVAETALAKIALHEGTTVENVRKHIQVAMISGLSSSDPKVQAQWRCIPHAGEVPTPEEVIAYYAGGITGYSKTGDF